MSDETPTPTTTAPETSAADTPSVPSTADAITAILSTAEPVKETPAPEETKAKETPAETAPAPKPKREPKPKAETFTKEQVAQMVREQVAEALKASKPEPAAVAEKPAEAAPTEDREAFYKQIEENHGPEVAKAFRDTDARAAAEAKERAALQKRLERIEGTAQKTEAERIQAQLSNLFDSVGEDLAPVFGKFDETDDNDEGTPEFEAAQARFDARQRVIDRMAAIQQLTPGKPLTKERIAELFDEAVYGVAGKKAAAAARAAGDEKAAKARETVKSELVKRQGSVALTPGNTKPPQDGDRARVVSKINAILTPL